MCDLIDLNSPDIKGLPDPKLASPLIPIPTDFCPNNDEQVNPLVMEKRESLGSNPFDTVLHETAEYVKKKGDPFEVMLQRALRSKSRKNAELRAHSVDFTDDFTPKRRRKYLKAMNRTLDESLIVSKVDLFGTDKKPAAKLEGGSVNPGANNADDTCDNNATKANSTVPIPNLQSHKIPVTDVNALESSILNQSTMNDTLLDVKFKEDDETSILLKKDILFKELFIFPSASTNLAPPSRFQRSLSQGDRKSPKRELRCPSRRSQSTTDASKKVLQSDNSAMSSFLDRGFLQAESKHSEQSVFSSLSNVSSIKNSVLLPSNLSSSMSSNCTMNHAFLNDDSLKTSHEKISTTENSMEIKSIQYDLSDLAERLSKLKCTIDRTTSIPRVTKELDESNSMQEKINKKITNDKLIDVDVFLPEQSFDREHNKSTTSTTSSDSIFVENNKKVNKSILNEAKALAKTFEELALKDSGSMDDLISNNTLWMSELLPAFEDEAVVDNLIELPASPKGDVKESNKSNEMKQSPINIDNTEENSMKGTELQFTECGFAVKDTIVTTLLLDLKKLIKAENNLEANKLIDNLESVLGVNYKNNTELLATCFNISNELRTLESSNDKSVSGEQSDKISIDKSQEENKKESTEEKLNSIERSLPHTNHKLENMSQATTISSDNSSTKISPYKDNSENPLDINIMNSPEIASSTSFNKEKDNHLDEKLAVKLLINLGKLLSGQAEDITTLRLLKNIGKALNIASNNLKIENESQTNDKTHDAQQITPTRASESERDERWFVSTKAAHERSFDSKSKLSKTTNRRSVSAIQSPVKNAANTQTYKHKGTFELKDLKKRFSSEPGLINTMTTKKIEIPGAGTAKLDNKKEKSLAVIDVKSKLKKKSDVVNKRGPIKAMLPVGIMHKRTSLGKQTTQSSQATTPPRSNKTTSGNKIISSTPNSVDNDYIPKKAVKSKPMASSTPDGQHSRMSSAQLMSADSCKKRNFSCDISPVTTHVDSNDEQKSSPKRSNKLPTPKKGTPKRQQTDTSGIPKYLTPPRKHNTSFDTNHQFLLESPQYLNKSLTSCQQRYSPVCPKRNAERTLQSPLKDSNKIATKVKPFKLISKFKRHSTGDFTEKENNYI